MSIDDYESMLRWHPEMILVSETPVTWQGFLSVPCRSNSAQSTRVKLKLTAPSYPSLRDAEIYFGRKVMFLCNMEFKQRARSLLQSSSKASSFLRQLQSLIGSFIEGAHCEDDSPNIGDNSTVGILQELKDAFAIPSEVRLLSDNNLSTIKLTLRNVSLKLQRTKHDQCPWTIVSSDLPEIPAFGPFETNVSTLSVARNKFRLQVEMLERTWSSLKQIDEYCCVIDPPEPKPCHLYRRIYLTPSLSMLIKIDPLNPLDLPEIKFLGSETEVEEMKNVVSNNIHKWNPNSSLLDNLAMLLEIYEFPKKEKKSNTSDNSIIVGDEECCICFSLELDGQSLPDKICSNVKCRRHFHTSCLLQWLQTVAGNNVVFNQIHGSCPHCGESISCGAD